MLLVVASCVYLCADVAGCGCSLFVAVCCDLGCGCLLLFVVCCLMLLFALLLLLRAVNMFGGVGCRTLLLFVVCC